MTTTTLNTQGAYNSFPHLDWKPDDLQRVLNQLGEGWTDGCWHYDLCPPYWNKTLELRLWVDNENPENREGNDFQMFGLELVDENCESLNEPTDYHGDNFDTVLNCIALLKLNRESAQ